MITARQRQITWWNSRSGCHPLLRERPRTPSRNRSRAAGKMSRRSHATLLCSDLENTGCDLPLALHLPPRPPVSYKNLPFGISKCGAPVHPPWGSCQCPRVMSLFVHFTKPVVRRGHRILCNTLSLGQGCFSMGIPTGRLRHSQILPRARGLSPPSPVGTDTECPHQMEENSPL